MPPQKPTLSRSGSLGSARSATQSAARRTAGTWIAWANALHAQGADFAHSDNDATWLAQIEQRLSQKTPWAKWQADLIKRAQDIISHGRLESGKLLALVRLVDKGENSPLTKGEINRLEALISAAH